MQHHTRTTRALGALTASTVLLLSACGTSGDGEANDADIAFASQMIPHHEQAVEMSDLLLAKSDIPADVTALAEQIRAEQGPEIEQMTAWLEQWGEPLRPEGGHGDQHGGHGGDMSGMEGMLSQTELEQLADAEGTDAARLFLEGMIAHHEGAVDMARQEVDEGTFQPAVDLAASIIETQQDEIATMRDMLSGL